MLKSLSREQQREVDKYVRVYAEHERYQLRGSNRAMQVVLFLRSQPRSFSYLDVGCGRGETLGWAREMGYEAVHGTEVVPQLCGEDVTKAAAWDLPFEDDAFDIVTCFDVMEHLLPGDEVPALQELWRVTKRVLALTVSNTVGAGGWCGEDFHINIRPYDEWDYMIRALTGTGEKSHQVDGVPNLNEMWIIPKSTSFHGEAPSEAGDLTTAVPPPTGGLKWP